ncbi:hypothetical protein [Campylobacter ureolyticus]|uniref:hypothetical protein n=1 Tax=Campylobacter ureolyticus TaxID=827 RepID=UPI0022B46534|nr:hypothetical protein [Campylobacter ureolyticus]MCZ6172263.1 hypothetical protein [Campylobacter ureolyticus]
MNKHLFSLVCVTALATVASAEVVEKINGVLEKVDLTIKTDMIYDNMSVTSKTKLDKNKKLKDREETEEKETTLVIKKDGLVTVTGDGRLTFKRDGDLVLKSLGILKVENKSSDFSFENVRMNNGVLNLNNSNFTVTNEFKTENNSQITLKADNKNKANIKAKTIKLDGSKMQVENYNLQSVEEFNMYNVDGDIKKQFFK